MLNGVPFGRYELLRRLAVGGMAEVYLAQRVSDGGFRKTCVIKRMLPHLAEVPELVAMFLDEARLAGQLSHPGIVQVFDFGRERDNYFLAMEHLAGEDLATLMRLCRAKNELMPVELAVLIGARAADALAYAHTATDSQGSPLRIVHRDVTPSNLFVTYDGVVKLLDFGIARAELRLQRTDAGQIKGKAAYMAPEHLIGEEIDARADVWSLGVCLFELLTGRRPFAGETPVQIANETFRARAPDLSTLRPEVPAALAGLVGRMLEREPTRRFGGAAQVCAALESFLGDAQSGRAASDRLGEYVRSTCGNDRVTQRTSPLEVADRGTEPVLGARVDAKASDRATKRRPIVRARPFALLLLLPVGGLVLGSFWSHGSRTPPVEAAPTGEQQLAGPYELRVTSSPEGADIYLDGVRQAFPTPATLRLAAPGRRQVSVAKDGRSSGSLFVELTPERPTTAIELVLAPPAVATSPAPPVEPEPQRAGRGARASEPPRRGGRLLPGGGLLSLESNVPVVAYLGTMELGPLPLRRVRVPAGRHRLHLVNRALGIDRETTVAVRSQEETRERALFKQGVLNVVVAPWADVWLNDTHLGQTPLAGRAVWEGEHRLRLVGPSGSKTLSLRIEPGKTTVVNERLP